MGNVSGAYGVLRMEYCVWECCMCECCVRCVALRCVALRALRALRVEGEHGDVGMK